MKTNFLYGFFFISTFMFAQTTEELVLVDHNLNEINNLLKVKSPSEPDAISDNGFNFEILDAGVNSKYSEFCSGFFRNKVIMVSSKKLGPLAKIDPKTGEGYQDLYCLDVDKNGRLSRPLLFSRILNTKYNEGQLSFSPNQKTVYFTRSTKNVSNRYKLYKADLEEDSHGNWVNEELLSINKEYVSIENPYLNSTGDKLYFSANMPDSYGGFDLYVCDVLPNGDLSEPVNLGNTVNSEKDEKYPSISKDSKYFYFSSKGHLNFGGYDVFESKILKNGYSKPRNMGNTINTIFDEVAYILAAKNKGYVTSNRRNGKGGYDLYTAINDEVIQNLKGKVFDIKSKTILPNSVVILKDEEGTEISRYITGTDAAYSFNVKPFENYNITVSMEGFNELNLDFLANRGTKTTYFKNLELVSIVPKNNDVERELRLLADNIFFDSNKYDIKKELYRVMNKIIYILKEHPEMRLAIDAHTDNVGNDAYNLNLSNNRAASVLNYLVTNGISKDRLQSKGYGETKPVIDCKNNCSEENLQTNRRVELVILNK
ncbi:MAG: OmpA family protein [Flavobacteriales bacterium]|nr:OmpA family protein [Flavobacteriales bacterium]NCP60495.1 OmpA family protein [Flavobacteriales bacterium]